MDPSARYLRSDALLDQRWNEILVTEFADGSKDYVLGIDDDSFLWAFSFEELKYQLGHLYRHRDICCDLYYNKCKKYLDNLHVKSL